MQCKICSTIVSSAQQLANHVRWQHSNTKKKCNECGRELDACVFERHLKRCEFKQSCELCGTTLPREKRSFNRPRFCNRSCAASYNNSSGKIGYSVYRKNNSIVKQETYRDVCFKHWPVQCALCGWNISVDVHHIDSNHSNNVITNLIPLCRNHHLLTEMIEHKDDINSKIKSLITKKFGELPDR